MKKAKKKKRRVGRPKGSKAGNIVWIDVVEPRCPKCDCTDRDWYGAVIVQDFEGVDAAGKDYNQILRRRTRCASCGQIRMERSFRLTRKSRKK